MDPEVVVPAAKKDALYSRCSVEEPGVVFKQRDLENFKIASSPIELLAICQALSDEHLFEMLILDARPCYRLRSRSEAQKLRTLTNDEYLVYSQVEATGTTGVWSRTLKNKTQLHKTVMDRCLKSLENKKFIKRVKSVKTPGQIIYMKVGLRPSEDVTGGSFFSNGELDIDFIEEVSKVIVDYVKKKSWYEMPKSHHSKNRTELSKKSSRRHATTSAISVVGVGAGDEAETEHAEESVAPLISWTGQRRHRLVPYPAGYPGYPSTQEILDAIEASGMVEGKDLSLPDIQHLVDVLVYDGRLEKMGANSIDIEEIETEIVPEERFRWARQYDEDVQLPGLGFSETPCSKCPVFALCEEGGPVDAKSCGYFDDWLGT